MKNKKIFYGWIIVAAACLIMGTTTGIVTNCNSLFIRPIAEDLGVSRQAVSTMVSLQNFGMMFTAFLAGRIFTEDNIVKVMRAAITVMVITYFCNSFVHQIWIMYITYLINGVMLCLVSMLPTTFLINNWFRDKVGFALGLASMGSGFGGAIFNMIAGHLMDSMGWRMTYRVLALCMAVMAVPCIFLVLKLRPSDIGLTPYQENGSSAQTEETPVTGYTFAEVRKMPKFWFMCFLTVLVGTTMFSMYSSISPHLQDKGYSLVFSANVLSVCLFAMAAGKVVIGKIFDRFGVRVGYCWACLCLLLGMVGMLFCRYVPMLIFLVLGVAFGAIFGAVVYPLTIPKVFGRKEYRAILGPFSALNSFGGVLGPLFAGKIFDLTGSYDPCFRIDIVILAVIILIMFRILPSREQEL